jgi:hypothetical protein
MYPVQELPQTNQRRRGSLMSSSMSFYPDRYTGATTDYLEEQRKEQEYFYMSSMQV